MFNLSIWHWIAIGGGVYLATSYTLFKFPLLLHRKKGKKLRLPPHKPLMMAHRGGAREGPENTFGNHMAALRKGMDGIEMDIRLSRDQQIVICHDPDLQRLTGDKRIIAGVNYKDIPPMRNELMMHFPISPNEKYIMQIGDDRTIPLFEDVVKNSGNAILCVDFKEPNPIIITKARLIIKRYNAEDRIIWGSVKYSTNYELMKKFPEITCFCSFKTAFKILIAFVTGLLGFMPILEESLCVPFASEELKRDGLIPNPTDTLKTRLLKKSIYWSIQILSYFDKTVFEHLHKRGMTVHYFVINTPKDFQRATRAGVDGIMTDCPTKLHAYFNSAS